MSRLGPYLLFVVLVALDQALKLWTVNHWAAMNWPSGNASPRMAVIPGFLDFFLTYNTGAAWSLFSGSALPLAVLRMAVGLGILVYLWRTARAGRMHSASLRLHTAYTYILAIIAAGAVGNAIDGVYQQKVTDMFYSYPLSWISQRINGQDFPIFNIADSCVVGGVIFLLILSLLDRKKPAESGEPRTESKI